MAYGVNQTMSLRWILNDKDDDDDIKLSFFSHKNSCVKCRVWIFKFFFFFGRFSFQNCCLFIRALLRAISASKSKCNKAYYAKQLCVIQLLTLENRKYAKRRWYVGATMFQQKKKRNEKRKKLFFRIHFAKWTRTSTVHSACVCRSRVNWRVHHDRKW